uniref:Uncharacterized protein n=1 Tax=Cannabis sativa TaxID=3483 RepID=A0A803NV73_CANSA
MIDVDLGFEGPKIVNCHMPPITGCSTVWAGKSIVHRLDGPWEVGSGHRLGLGRWFSCKNSDENSEVQEKKEEERTLITGVFSK